MRLLGRPRSQEEIDQYWFDLDSGKPSKVSYDWLAWTGLAWVAVSLTLGSIWLLDLGWHGLISLAHDLALGFHWAVRRLS